ncbi:hypothetical protein CkaCkLH20_07964 [Colletotrichum karsti]|uniref:Transporter n=1 Tax=Colletotrichum karsti TaxID=1095194 RepID=A0A9P6I5L0_9PEZI|nr:uncharacterized protein CkaCkLH20_07964 [Colletotrichum karsti]KAF9874401.1 hypothetical protein CkaCkLH20_07964 [Colletotrichum karsti]
MSSSMASEAQNHFEIADKSKKGDTAECHHVERGELPETAAINEGQTSARKKTNPAEIKLVKRLDRIIIPVLWIMYWFNYLDRNAITVARLNNMEKDLNITSTEYQTCVSILFVGYILGQIPSTQDFKGLLLTRFFLGVLEAPFYPGALYILAMFYTRQEIATRISILFTANICGTAFAGLIAVGVFEMEQVAGLAGWRWLFIIQGILTFVISIASAFILPNEPLNTHWLSESEKTLAQSRVAVDTVELQENTSTWAGLVEAARDPRLWVLVLAQHFHMAASNFKNFFPTIVDTLGFSRNATLVLTCPPYLISGAISIAWAASSGK